jgi:hypothetical protein
VLAAVVLDIVVDSLPQHETRQLRGTEHWLEHTPEGDDNILRRRNNSAQEIDFEIQIAVIDFVDDVLLDDFLDTSEVNDVARALVYRAADGDVEDVVMTVPIWIVALAEDAPVLLFGESGTVNAVRGAEVQTTSNRDVRWHTKNEPRGYPRGSVKWNGKGFMKPNGKLEVLTTPSAVPRTGGMTSV